MYIRRFLLIMLFSSLLFGDDVTILVEAQTPPFQNIVVGTATGPEGRTNIQTLADFEDGVLYRRSGPQDADGFGFSDDNSNFTLSIDNGGPTGSTKCLKVTNLTGPYQDYGAWKYAQFYWTGGRDAFMKSSLRANSHSVWVKPPVGFSSGYPKELTIGGYAQRRTPSAMSDNNPESNNMHNYFQIDVDFSDGAWKEIVVHNNFTHQRSEKHKGGYDAFLGNADVWADHTRLYWQWAGGSPTEIGPDSIYMDNFTWFYENPFLAAYPQVSRAYAQAGQTAIHPVIVWNTHPTKTRNFWIRVSGTVVTASSGNISYWSDGYSITDTAGNIITQTGPIAPGQGFAFHLRHQLVATDKDGAIPVDGTIRTGLFSVFEDPAGIPNPYPYQQANPGHNVAKDAGNRYDLSGVGFTIKTTYGTAPVAGNPLPVNNLRVIDNGGSWVDLNWESPAISQDGSERSTDPAAMAYNIRYSKSPIIDDASWDSAVPVESVSPVFGPGITQRYAVRGLEFNTLHYAAVRTYNEDNVGSPISSVSFTTNSQDIDLGYPLPPDTAPPTTPTNLQATATSSSKIDLSWEASTDDVGVIGYNIYREGAKVATSSTTSYSDTGLMASTTYTYTVSAYDLSGKESGQSTAASATTLTPQLTSITVLPGSTTVQPGGTRQFTAQGFDKFNNSMAISPVWSVSGGGTIDQTGLFSADFQEGGPFTVTATDSGIFGTAQGTIASGPQSIAHWQFDEGTGTTVGDASGNGNTGTVSGATWVLGKIDSALDFDGVDDYVDMGDVNATEGLSAITISAWVKPDAITYYDTIAVKGTSSSDYVWSFALGTAYGSPDGISFQIRGVGGASFNSPSPVGVWQHLCVTWDGSTMRGYRDGIEISVLPASGTMNRNSTPLNIGHYAGRYFNGSLDDVRIYNYALNDAEIQDIYITLGKPGKPMHVNE